MNDLELDILAAYFVDGWPSFQPDTRLAHTDELFDLLGKMLEAA